MENPELRRQATQGEGLAARRHLRDAGLTSAAVRWATRDLRRPFSGVYLSGWASITREQTWRAATQTAPDTALHLASAAGLWRMRKEPGAVVSVVRPGTRGVTHSTGLRVSYSKTLDGNVVQVGGIPVTTPERTLIDLWPHLGSEERLRMLREALRLQLTTSARLLAVLHDHRGRRGTSSLREETLRRLGLPFHRCRSAAEAFALVVLHEAGVAVPEVNVLIGGEEADLSWHDPRQILEIDGPQYHRLPEEDARKAAVWMAAGYRVDRINTNVLFADPAALLCLAPPPSAAPNVPLLLP